jgi:predicted PurR-regulated permease PerM
MFGSSKKVIVRIEFPTKQVLKLLLILSLVFLSFKLKDVIILVFLSFILMASIKPMVLSLHTRLKIPKTLAVTISYILILVAVIAAFYLISKPLAAEIRTLSENFPTIVASIVNRFPLLSNYIDPNSLGETLQNSFTGLANDFSNVGNALQNAFSITVTAFSFLIEFVTVIIISVYLMIDRDKILHFFTRLFKLDNDKFTYTYEQIEGQLGSWVRGQLLLGVIVGFFTWFGLTMLDVKFALPLGFLAGILEIVPVIGPIITAVPITLIGFSISPVTGLLCLGLCVFIQQAESHLLVPSVMKRAVGLSPVVTLISLLIGSKLLGLMGSIIAVPIAAVFSVILLTYLGSKES